MTTSLTLRPLGESLYVKESPQFQPPGASSIVTYSLDPSDVLSGTPSAPAVTVINETTGNDVTSDILSGAVSVDGDGNILFTLTSMRIHNAYKAAINFTIGTEKFTRYMLVRCRND